MAEQLLPEATSNAALSETKKKINVSDIKQKFSPAELLDKIHANIKNNDLINRAQEARATQDEVAEEKMDWVLLNRDQSLAVVEGDLVVLDPEAVGEYFIWIEDSDVIDAIAFCVAQSIVAMPQVRSLQYDQLSRNIDKAFWSVKQKCLAEKVYDWGKFCYNVYGWGSMAVGIATNPAVMVAIAETTVSVLLLLGFA